MPEGLQVANFIRFYGMETYSNTRWNTRDTVIPFKLFRLLYDAIPAVQAIERLNAGNAVMYGVAGGMGGKDSESSLRRISDRWLKEAFGE